MKVRLPNGEISEMEPMAVAYPNDILDGVFLNGEDNYGFLSDHIEAHRDVMEGIGEMDFYDMAEMDIDYEQLPHAWVVKSVAKLVIQTAEGLLKAE